MPELPEVETVARQLAPRLVGRTVRRLTVLDARLRDAPFPRVAGRPVESVRRSGKRVLVRFGPDVRHGGGSLWLAVHLRMTGRLIWVGEGRRVPSEHVRARLDLDRGRLVFQDTRRFGTFSWYRDERAARPAGLDPLSRAFDARRMLALGDGSRQPVKTWLLRQDRLVGLGNIYASEILHAAGVSPDRPVGGLGGGEAARVVRATKRILRRAIAACGTTFSDFQDSHGLTGSYQAYLAVYGREGERCPRCGEAIVRTVQQQRSTYHCPGCQR